MSIASELNRLLQAKSDLATSIANKGVTVPAATTIDGYAALVDQIQQGGGTLPYDAKIEYLQGDGASYIDTGIVDKGQYKIVAQLSCTWPTTSGQFTFIYGCCEGWSSKARVARIQQGSYFYLWYNDTEKSSAKFTQTFFYIEDIPTAFNVNGSALWSRSSATNDNTRSIYVFACSYGDRANFGNNAASSASLKYYNFKVYNGNTLLINLIPVRVGTVGCMYDKISGNLFYNQGTGNFVLGPDVT